MATGKVDGVFFVLGALAGIFLFGETVSSFALFFESSFMGRFTLPELFGVSYGVVVLGVVAMALFCFWGAEKIEAAMGGPTAQKAPKRAVPAAGLLVALAVLSLVIGQPSNADRWKMIETEQGVLLEQRAVQIQPVELLSIIHDSRIKTVMIDVRDERHYNQFHIHDARLMPLEGLVAESEQLMQEPANTVYVVMSNDEARATEAWKILRAESLPNVYILEGGVNNWIRTWGDADFVRDRYVMNRADDEPAFRFELAIGARHPAAEPVPHSEAEFEPKVKLEIKRAPTSGGCG
jgi:rhodanese-related sulfurtransferase